MVLGTIKARDDGLEEHKGRVYYQGSDLNSGPRISSGLFLMLLGKYLGGYAFSRMELRSYVWQVLSFDF